jgi:hypothetical protein
MRNDQIFVLLLVVLLPMSGCFGGVVGDAEADDDDSDDDQPRWVNDVGTSPINWNLTLNQNQWLEVKSAVGLWTTDSNSSDEETNQYPLTVIEQNGWKVGSSEHSPIFGGTYSMCGLMVEESCFSSDPDGDWFVTDWTIIYRIHSV